MAFKGLLAAGWGRKNIKILRKVRASSKVQPVLTHYLGMNIVLN